MTRFLSHDIDERTRMSNCDHQLTTNRADTRGVTIEAAPRSVFEFIANPQNLPAWAVGFCRSIRHEAGERWVVTTATGEVPIRYEINDVAGTVDFRFSPVSGIEATAYSRVIPNGAGAEYTFTQFQFDGMPNEAFDAQVRALANELQVLRGLLNARTACPT
jgi:hypothetical protein